MKAKLHFTREPGDGKALSDRHITQIAGFLRQEMTQAELEGVAIFGVGLVRDPGLVGLDRMRANLFSEDDVLALSALVARIANRSTKRIEGNLGAGVRDASPESSARSFEAMARLRTTMVDEAIRNMAHLVETFVRLREEIAWRSLPSLPQPARSLAIRPS